MTPTQINLLSRQTAEAYFADDNMVLSDAIEQAINTVLADCETGDLLAKLAQAEKDRDSWLAQYMARGAVLRAVGAGLSFDPDVDRDLETCARRVYHAYADALARIEVLSARVVDAEMEAAKWRERVQPKVSAAQGAVEP